MTERQAVPRTACRSLVLGPTDSSASSPDIIKFVETNIGKYHVSD